VALTPGTRLGPDEIAAQIGVGGMGEVYRAHDTRLKRDGALKILLECFASPPLSFIRLGYEHGKAAVSAKGLQPRVGECAGRIRVEHQLRAHHRIVAVTDANLDASRSRRH
jgi:serine/threonine protein kinase